MGCFSSKSILDERIEYLDSRCSQTEFRYIDGRRFHNVENVKYNLPNDENETDRLHLQHFLLRYLWQSNFSAPVDHLLSKPDTKVLDVVGLDISPHQPSTIKPKNFEFVRANAEERLPFDDNTFDFVFQRYLVFSLTEEKWPHVVNELILGNLTSAYASLKPVLPKKLQVSDEEYDELTKISEKEVVELNSYFQIVRVYASKAFL
ncbi:12007_t:CDS:2 [Racocetra fulgida]|uniref:12007_t:CDS:1 n=1 Tax=Racocetra fulgida TaxID=60492 RepID=A0A9N9C3I7_9GLOM|nr:12007_t:CDS:2 [Racocetra fulgida]